MVKILFLSYNYPHGLLGPSTLCTFRIMEELCRNEEYEIHNISLKEDGEPAYRVIDKVNLHHLSYAKKEKSHKKIMVYMNALLTLPIYPFSRPFDSRRFYSECCRLIGCQHYDLVVSQCYPEECVWAGTKLKEKGVVDRLMVIFWDNLYGQLPRRIIPKRFALRKQQKAESWVAQNADLLVSLYPIKDFHQQYGDVPEAKGKRIYLGIPSVVKPRQMQPSSFRHVLKAGMINILYSGTIFRKEHVAYVIDLLNKSCMAEIINLIFFSKGVSDDDFGRMREKFKGNIENNGWIPVDELLALYPSVDFFMSYPGIQTAIRSKVYEYMSYGKPLFLLYNDDQDVNVSTFSQYPAFLAVDERKPVSDNVMRVETFLKNCRGKVVPFEETERIFSRDTVHAYVDLISRVLGDVR